MRRIVDTGAFLLTGDLAFKIHRHAFEFGDHALDLGDPPALFIDLKLFQADQRFA